MVSKELKEIVLTKLRELPVCIPNSTRTQWTIRCPYCGDSHNQAHGHLSIKIDLDDDSAPMLYRCFKCDVSGIVNDQFLQEVGVYLDSAMVKELRNINRRATRRNLFTNDRIENFVVPLPEENEINRNKLEYINTRLGLHLTYNDCARLKIVLDLDHFMRVNEISEESLGMSHWAVTSLVNYYVGFLSQSNNILVCRCIVNDDRFRRYIKVIFNRYNQNPASFYMIPATIQLISDEPLNIYIAEGPFDIISIHENFGKDSPRNIYAAICGYGPGMILKYLLYNGLLYKTNVHLYCDNDKSNVDECKVLLKHPEIVPWIYRLYFHRNAFEGEKDYGVPKERIIDGNFLMGQNGMIREN